MAEKDVFYTEMRCWRTQATGMAALDVAQKFAIGATCPNEGTVVEVVVEKGAKESAVRNAAAQQHHQRCAMCGLSPTANDFKFDI